MILFVSSHDEPTRANHAVGSQLAETGDTFLGADRATRVELHKVLETCDAPLFAMTHGRIDTLWAQHKEKQPAALLADTPGDIALLGTRPVFAHACWTARDLGRTACAGGCFWWGFQIPVSAPDDGEFATPLFVELFRFIKRSFMGRALYRIRTRSLSGSFNAATR